jgi:Flp pilus assembly pilin Flp
MVNTLRRFISEEDGMGTVEIVIIIAVLVGLALIFRKNIYNLVDGIFKKIFDNASAPTDNPKVGEPVINNHTIG